MPVGPEDHHILQSEAWACAPLEVGLSRGSRPNKILGRPFLSDGRNLTLDHLNQTIQGGCCHQPEEELVGRPPPVEGLHCQVKAGSYRQGHRFQIRYPDGALMPHRRLPVCKPLLLVRFRTI
jgi:hypothetical protein